LVPLFFFSGINVMVQVVKVKASNRTEHGSKAAKKLRKTGMVPCVIYGHKESAVSLSASHDELMKIVKHGVRLVDLETDGKVEKALIRDVQWDYLGNDVIHVDFSRVSADEKIHITVSLELKGTAPGLLAGGVLDMPMHSIHIECLVINIPDVIRVNVSELQVGGVIHVKQLVAPEGVKFLADEDAVVVHIVSAKAEVASTMPPELGAAATEPEVIKKPKPVADDEE
jgi:large subunit ribosomal protein L25